MFKVGGELHGWLLMFWGIREGAGGFVGMFSRFIQPLGVVVSHSLVFGFTPQPQSVNRGFYPLSTSVITTTTCFIKGG